MRILGKLGNEITFLALATENIRRGDYLLISENVLNRRLVAQVYDESYLEALGTAEDMVRQEVVNATIQGVEQDPIWHPEGDALFHSLQVFAHARAGCSDRELWAAALLHGGLPIVERSQVPPALRTVEGMRRGSESPRRGSW